MQTIIRVEKLSKTFQQNRALNAVDLHIAAGEMVALPGPSGSGKDSLLAELRQQEHEQLLNAHRYITRAANAGNENHIALSEQEFFIRAGQNLLALSWYANGFYITGSVLKSISGCSPVLMRWSTVHALTCELKKNNINYQKVIE